MQITISLQNTSNKIKEDCPVTACLGDTMTIWYKILIPWRFYDLLPKFLTNSSSKNSGRTKDNAQRKTQKMLTPHHGKFFLTRNRDTEKLSHFARPTWAISGCVILVQIQCWPCLQQEVRLQSLEVPFYWHNDDFNIAGISVFLQDLKGPRY